MEAYQFQSHSCGLGDTYDVCARYDGTCTSRDVQITCGPGELLLDVTHEVSKGMRCSHWMPPKRNRKAKRHRTFPKEVSIY